MIKKLVVEKADRLYHLPSVIDDFLPKRKEKNIIRQDVIDLARFIWPSTSDTATARQTTSPSGDLQTQLQSEVALWYKERFGGKIAPGKEIFFGGSIRQIINLLALVYFNPGDMVFIPDPGIWHYRASAAISSAETVPYHLLERNHYKPSIAALSENLARLAKAVFINSPHNPTGQIYNKDDFNELMHMAGRENLLIILDQAFEGLTSETHPASIFSQPGGRKVGLELYSFAYNFGQPVPAPAFAIAQPAIITGLNNLARIFGITMTPEQLHTGLHAIENKSDIENLKNRFNENRKRMDHLCQKLRLFPTEYRTGPFYWTKLPGRKQSRRFCRLLYLRCGILAVPGIAFGENGEGFVRFSLTADTESYDKAIEAAQKLFQKKRVKSDG
ncbi:MAG: pyridoxal phosphate-dependent aminotransferase [candidate division Zixibacteria bacterium]|nr:pyridoxal phosphate-dependent aminotransferase [candidate division Zixibacteria bacterium]